MKKMIVAVVALAAIIPFGSASAGGLAEAGELEAARANARAGGPVSERDAELLERWGCTSGTNSWACRPHHRAHHYYRAARRHHRD
jgi:hypothetical protein